MRGPLEPKRDIVADAKKLNASVSSSILCGT